MEKLRLEVMSMRSMNLQGFYPMRKVGMKRTMRLLSTKVRAAAAADTTAAVASQQKSPSGTNRIPSHPEAHIDGVL